MGGRANLVWRDVEMLTPQMLEGVAGCRCLDLTGNRLTDIRALRDLNHLDTLILDNNMLTSHLKVPPMPALRTLWVNNNNIANLSIFIDQLVASTPRLAYLSMLSNNACPNFFNGGSLKQYHDYRKFVISRLRHLTQLDAQPVTEEERREAIRLYGDLASSVAFEEADEGDAEVRRRREEEKRHREREEVEKRRAEKIRKRQERKEAARLRRERETAIALARQQEEERLDRERARKLGARPPSHARHEREIASLLPEVDAAAAPPAAAIAIPLDLPEVPGAGSLPAIAVPGTLTDSEEWSSDEDWDQ